MSLDPYYSDSMVQRSALAEANAAKTGCPSGHPYDDQNTMFRKTDGARICRACGRLRGRERYARLRTERQSDRVAAPRTKPTGVPYLDSHIDMADDCWEWRGYVNPNGYGVARIGGHSRQAHRAVYATINGEVPDYLVLDHLCRNRRCVNPDHLEPVTSKTNILRGEGAAAVNARKTHCVNGHALSEENLVPGVTWRQCRVCARRYARVSAQKRRAKKKSAAQ